MLFPLILALILVNIPLAFAGCKCYKPFSEPIKERVLSARPHTYLKEDDLPQAFDWRNVNGTNYCSKVLTQQNPSVCGSCWAEAATGKVFLFVGKILCC